MRTACLFLVALSFLSACSSAEQEFDPPVHLVEPTIPPPINLAASADNRKVTLTWGASEGAESYEIKRGTSSGGPYEVSLAASTTTYEDTGVSNGFTYYYVVAAKRQDMVSALSNEASARPEEDEPTVVPTAASTFEAYVVNESQISLTWVDVADNESGYRLERKVAAEEAYAVIAVLPRNSNRYYDSGLFPSTEYNYRLFAYNAVGDSSATSVTGTTPPTTVVPASPTSLVATSQSSTQISLSWKDNSNNESGFKIERKTGVGGTFALIATVGSNVNSFLNSGLSPSTQYYYRVYAYNGIGLSQYYSNEANATTGPDTSPPSGFGAYSGDGFVSLSWNPVPDATAYNVYWSTSSGISKTTATKLLTTSKAFTRHSGLVNGRAYYYVVTAVRPTGESTESVSSSATPANGSGTWDPGYQNQWHLKNTGQVSPAGPAATSGEDINVEPVWSSCGTGNTCRGEGVRVAVVDEDLEIAHEDLFQNIATGLSYNYVNANNDPSYDTSNIGDAHGTMVAGIIAARDKNDTGFRGVAPRASMVGYNFLANPTASNRADAMSRGASGISVSNNSWGNSIPGVVTPADTIWKDSINLGLTSGRGGLGTVYVFAAGNSDQGDATYCPDCKDNTNYSEFSNHRGIIVVGALNAQGGKASYSERGASLWVSAYGGEYCSTGHTVSTTDRTGAYGANNSATAGDTDYSNQAYTMCMNGTSAATPQVSGVVALMLQANPTLGWRDVRSILAITARVNDPADPEWSINGAGFYYNPKYGFGTVDASAAVTLAMTWVNVGPELIYETPLFAPNVEIPDDDASGVTRGISISGSSITELEYVEVTFSASHTYSGDLEISLISPSGAVSWLAEQHKCPNHAEFSGCGDYDAWVFGTANFLGEGVNGTWWLVVKDRDAITTGTFQSWKLKFYGN